MAERAGWDLQAAGDAVGFRHPEGREFPVWLQDGLQLEAARAGDAGAHAFVRFAIAEHAEAVSATAPIRLP
jgi:hypothetical protein